MNISTFVHMDCCIKFSKLTKTFHYLPVGEPHDHFHAHFLHFHPLSILRLIR